MDSIQLGVQRAISEGDMDEIMETVEEKFMSKAMVPITTNGVTGKLNGFNLNLEPYLLLNATKRSGKIQLDSNFTDVDYTYVNTINVIDVSSSKHGVQQCLKN